MTETKHPGEKLTVAPAKTTLSLKRPGVEQGVVKQSFSHGRTKTVMVEKVKSRREHKPEATPAAAAPAAPVRRPTVPAGRSAPAPSQTPAPAAKPGGGVVLRKLTDEERNARASALETAKVREAEERRVAEADAARRNERDEVERTERDAAAARKREEEERRVRDAEAKQRAERTAEKRFGEGEEKTAKPATTTTARAKPAGPAPGNLRNSLRNPVPETEEDEG